MVTKKKIRISTAALSAAIAAATLISPFGISGVQTTSHTGTVTANAAETLSISDMPNEYQYAADWIWENRIDAEKSTERRNTIFDQIIAGKGTINYVVRWQSYKTVTLEQRKQFETLLSDSINAWNDWLAGYENWPYDHIEVKVVGWAVIDESCLEDLQPDEVVYTNLTDYDSQYDTSNGYETIPDKLPNAPDELSRMEHFSDSSYQYPGGLDKRFDMYMWATEGFPTIGGCGGDWGQRLSDTAYLNMLDGTGSHVLIHELGHGFGMTDFYGDEGESDGYPPGGFPTENGGSLMMSGSASEITDFDGWMLRYMWTKIKDDEGRFDIEAVQTTTEATTEAPTSAPTEVVTEVPTEAQTEAPTSSITYKSFEDEITDCGDGYVVFGQNGKFTYSDSCHGDDESKNPAYYEVGDKISISFAYNESTGEITEIYYLSLIENIREQYVTGDVNNDGVFNISDVVAMQSYIINSNLLANWKAGDLCSDECIDTFDLVLIKNLLISD